MEDSKTSMMFEIIYFYFILFGDTSLNESKINANSDILSLCSKWITNNTPTQIPLVEAIINVADSTFISVGISVTPEPTSPILFPIFSTINPFSENQKRLNSWIINSNMDDTYSNLTIFSNPIGFQEDNLNVNFNSQEESVKFLTITNINGIEIMDFAIEAIEGNNATEIDIAELSFES